MICADEQCFKPLWVGLGCRPGGAARQRVSTPLPGHIYSCLYSIALWSKLFEPYDLETLRVSADPWALKCPKMLVKRPRIMKSATFACMPVTLRHPNLSHIDFLDSPAAIHSSRTPISDATQSASPNELMHPRKTMKNHTISIYSFLGSGPAIFPAE